MAEDDVWHIATVGKYHGQEVVNTYHIRMKSGDATIETAVDSIILNFLEALDNHQSSALSWNVVRARQLVGGDGAYELELPAPVVGDLPQDTLPTQIALVVSLKTGFAGRRKRGRLYIPGNVEPHTENSLWHPDVVALFQTVFNTAVQALGKNGTSQWHEWGVYSRRNGGVPIPGTSPVQYGPPWSLEGFTAITSAVVKNVPATQRRRRIGVGS
jgi:hypothetical protein